MRSPVPPDNRPTRLPGAIASEVLDELVVYSPTSSQAISLNRTARAIWELCDGTRSVETICLELAEAADIAPASIRGDVQAAIDQLRDLGLLATDVR